MITEHIKELLIIAISASLINNVVLSQFYGLCPFLGVSKQLKTASGMGAAVIFVITLASLVSSVIYNFVLVALGIEYLKTIIFILVIAALVQFVEMFLKKMVPSLYESLGVFLPLITTNCAVLGTALTNAQENYNVLYSIVNGLFVSIGFAISICILAGIRERLQLDKIPKPFRGMPIVLIIAGLMAIAFSGFSGLL